MPRLLIPGARRVIRSAPALVEVQGLDQRAIGLLPAGRRDVEALAGLQVGSAVFSAVRASENKQANGLYVLVGTYYLIFNYLYV